MYLKLFNKILDSSIADNRTLRHFFIDLLLLADPDGNVIMTKQAIAHRIRAPLNEVEEGLEALMEPDENSFTVENQGRRIAPLEGLGYGWKILNYAYYRDLKSAQQLRDSTKQRVQRHREKKRAQQQGQFAGKNPPPAPRGYEEGGEI